MTLTNLAILAGAFIVLVILIWFWPKWQVRSLRKLDEEKAFSLENEARKTVIQLLGGLFFLMGFYFTWANLQATQENADRTLRVALEGQITDRFSKATAQLGDTKLQIRLGGIYALERISAESERDYWTIIEVLTAYVRENAVWDRAKVKKTTPPAPDIQAVLSVLGRREWRYERDFQHPDLRGAYLGWAKLYDAYLRRVIFDGADMSAAELQNADLEGASVRGAKLSGANLTGADLRGAFMDGARLDSANLARAHLEGVDLTRAQGLTWNQVKEAIIDGTTRLPIDVKENGVAPERSLQSR